jgi:polyisoprenoid-binding protein YceI
MHSFGGTWLLMISSHTEKYPEAVLEITSVDGNHVEGNLTIKDITHPIGFDVAVNVNGDVLTATGLVVVDRTKYEMKFRSGNFFKTWAIPLSTMILN